MRCPVTKRSSAKGRFNSCGVPFAIVYAMTQPEPLDDDSSYPDSWKTADIRRRDERDADAARIDDYLRGLSGIQFAQLVARVRGGQH